MLLLIVTISALIIGVMNMATLQEVNDKLTVLATNIALERAEVQAGIASLKAEIQALKDQLASGTVVTPADLDNLVGSLNTLDAAIKAISEA